MISQWWWWQNQMATIERGRGRRGGGRGGWVGGYYLSKMLSFM